MSHSSRRRRTQLLDLPVEVLKEVVFWIALLKYEYSESRRPSPSALQCIASTNRLLRELALPLLFHVCTSRTRLTALDDADGGPASRLQEARSYVRYLRLERPSFPAADDFRARFAGLRRLLVAGPTPRLGEVCFSLEQHGPALELEHLELRRGNFHWERHLARLNGARFFPNLKTLVLRNMSPSWVEPFYRNSHLVSLSLTAVSDVPFDLSDPFWRQLERLDVQVESPFQGQHGSSIAAFLQNFPFPAGQVRLRRLSVATQLQTRFVSSPRALQDIVTVLVSTFSHAPLESLAFDDHASCESEDLVRLAAGFPALRSLSLGDRMVWTGSRRDLLSSLAPLSSLKTLSCRLLPVVPPSLFDASPQIDASEPASEGDDLEQFASPASIALEAATVLPALALVGFSGQSSAVEWFRVRRDAEGQPCKAEAVTLVDLDLDRP